MAKFGDREDSPSQDEAGGEEKRQGEPADDLPSGNPGGLEYPPPFEAPESNEGAAEPLPYGPEPVSREGMLAPQSVLPEEYEAIEQGKETGRSKRRWVITTREILETALLALLIFLTVRASFQNFRVEGSSMVPSLETGQFLIVNKLAYATIDLSIFDWVPFYDAGEDSAHHIFGSPGRGDVVVFQAPQNPQQDFIKRIIGVPGDVMEIKGGGVVLNGEPLLESYIRGETGNCRDPCLWTVPEGHYFVLGDNRTGSSDSRVFGFVPEENIVGKTLFSYWPLGEAGFAPNESVSYASGEE